MPHGDPYRIQVAFDGHCLVAEAGLILPAARARPLGLPGLVRYYLDLGHVPGRVNTGDKLLTLAASAPAFARAGSGRRRLLRRCRLAAQWWHCQRPGVCGQGFVHSGHLSVQLPLGPWEAVGPREPGVAGPGLEGRSGTRRQTSDHRPGFQHLRDLRPEQGGRAPSQPAPYLIRGLHRSAGLSPAPRRGRRYRRVPDGPSPGGPGHHRPGC